MTNPLVDADGYPLAEVDIITVRKTRVKIIYLQNDLKSLMDEIEKGLHEIHAKARTKKEQPDHLTEKHTEVLLEQKPFLLVDAVTDGSPAAKAGLKVNDLVTRFGSVNISNFSGLQMIGSLVQNSKSKELIVNIKRGEAEKVVKLVPDTWEGRGLLGCNVVPIKK